MHSFSIVAAIFVLVSTSVLGNSTQLSSTFYDTCPNMTSIIHGVVEQAQRNDTRVGAKLIWLHFHDYFVNGCDGSILLDNADEIESEKDAIRNKGAEGYDIVDGIKTALENFFPGVVSCADILALVFQILVYENGGPSWEVQLGRRDSRTANRTGADHDIPTPQDNLKLITEKFRKKGLDSTDLVALSGAHTFGQAKCRFFDDRLYNFNGTSKPNLTIDVEYMKTLSQTCSQGGKPSTLTNLDQATPDAFDNYYYKNLRGLLQIDQELFSTSSIDTVSIVNLFANNQSDFFDTFAQSMIKLRNIRPLTGSIGEIKADCKRVN
ncbi:unnamed protein product [Malus baccata var. baccata]